MELIEITSHPLFILGFPIIIGGIVKFWFDRKIEKVKKNHSIDTYKFQNEINSLKEKENFKFNKLHEQRFEVLKKTYSYLNKSLTTLKPYVNLQKIIPPGTTSNEFEDKEEELFREAHLKFVKYFTKNIIFFDEDLEQLIGSYLHAVGEVYTDFNSLKIWCHL
jgi:hypothetical protein